MKDYADLVDIEARNFFLVNKVTDLAIKYATRCNHHSIWHALIKNNMLEEY